MADYYVRTDGNNSNDGLGSGTDHAWLTLAKAASTVPDAANHTINVAAGTYAEEVADWRNGASPGYRWWKAVGTVSIQTFQVSGSWQKITGFTFVGTGSASNTAAIIFSPSKTNVVIDSCIFTECLRQGIGGTTAVSYVTVSNCTFYKVNETAINLWTTEDHWTIINNEISHTQYGVSDANGINLHGSNHLVSGNYIHDILYSETGTDAHIDAIQWNGPDSGTGTIIEKNHIYLWQEAASAVATSYAFMFGGGSGTIIRNNLVESWGGYNTGSSGTPQGMKIYNNTFVSNIAWVNQYFGSGISIAGGSGHEIKNNILVNFENDNRNGNMIYLSGGASVTSTNNLFWNSDSSTLGFPGYTPDATDIQGSDPVFVTNYTDFHLQSASPAKDAGATIATVTDDYAGVSRPQGAGYDIGAYEYYSAEKKTLFRP